MGENEAEELRDDIRILRAMVDAALDQNNPGAFETCVTRLRERREQLEQLELDAALAHPRRRQS